ncbi:hypothetical protein [Bradymonas sediminis]|uniref:hypothetical protein n=1 Tax=Bradymonas sediminis TaxID=1548548 RepID=UPI0010DDCAC5|nr:hypothetical protein [Bradymonas sediminis]TDP77432.1 hypothetical protein DFR33_101334 [Bradymonas sediminis]
MRLRFRFLPLLLVFVAAFFFAGCVNVVGGGAGLSLIVFLVVALGMGVVACSGDDASSNNTTGGWDVGTRDIGTGDTSGPRDVKKIPDTEQPDVEDEDAGHWEPCCNDGVVESCYCPANTACNYGMFETCDDGSCSYGIEGCADSDAGSVDAGEPDIGEPDAGEPDVIEPDAGEPDVEDPDAGEPGTWEACCKDGVVDSCFCPAGMACNYGMFQDCGEGTCVFGGGTCPDDGEGL